MSDKTKTFIVCYGDKVVELEAHGLSKEEATIESERLTGQGYNNVRIRLEDPVHPTWPLNFDAQ
jgi:hypothetical protein